MEFCVIEYDDGGNVHKVHAPMGVTGDRPAAVKKLCDLVAEHTGMDNAIEQEEIDALLNGSSDTFGTDDGWGWDIKEVFDY